MEQSSNQTQRRFKNGMKESRRGGDTAKPADQTTMSPSRSSYSRLIPSLNPPITQLRNHSIIRSFNPRSES
jgi:hypothetical protein